MHIHPTIHLLRWLLVIAVLFAITAKAYAAKTLPAPGAKPDNAACIDCHGKRDDTLVNDWKNSAHARATPAIDCVNCHGRQHTDMAARARPDQTCINCHGGEKAPVAHSYSSSKHGTLMRMEKNRYDWKLPLRSANYRAPGCSYCHMHQGRHNVSASVRHDLMRDNETAAIHDYTRSVCQDCHAPRYISRLFENGEAMLEIARKKVREADKLLQQAGETFSPDELKPAREQFEKMQHHLTNVHLGVGHQSPDYQWWHGQPALDGDLLRIKDHIGELYRLRKPAPPHRLRKQNTDKL